MAVTLISVRSTEKGPAAALLNGSVTFTLSKPLQDQNGKIIFECTPVTTPIIAGTMTPVSLPANDSTEIWPPNTYYNVTWTITGLPHSVSKSIIVYANSPG